ncbi:MAG: nuclear transport factor 2 family protein [Candidatus Poribacteria bacterium]|nr:nuclear transport factor 2 family protein [Candidatus Poribacteria bacterium]
MDADQTVKSYFEALMAGDADRLIEMMSSTDYYVKVGTEPDEHVEGGENAGDYYRKIVASAEDFTIAFEHLDVQERGDVAWFYTRQIWQLKWQGVYEELAMRMTGVLEKGEGGWKFVQIHASMGVPA